MWFRGHDVSDHLTKRLSDIVEADRTVWDRIDAQLVTLLWQSIDVDLIPLFRVCENYFDIWSHAQQLYTNDIVLLCIFISNLFIIKNGDSNVPTYLDRIHFAVTDFNTMLSVTVDLNEQMKQRDKLFMVLTLVGLGPNMEGVRSQILSNPTIPTMEEVFAWILRSTQAFFEALVGERSILTYQTLGSSSVIGPEGGRG